MKAKFLLKTISTSLVFSIILFIGAGKLNYFQGWIFLGTNIITAFMNYWYIRNNEELMNERSQFGENTKSWDKLILGLSGLTYLANVIIAGLDFGRFTCSSGFHWSFYALGVILTLVGQVIFLTARKENQYFSSVVRIQSERGHRVCDTGLYRTVRHPGYLGMIISLLAFPLLTGSLWSIITVGIAIILLFIRTYLEDNTLKDELDGYLEYTQKTSKRLIPFIW